MNQRMEGPALAPEVAMTINETIRRWPDTVAVFHRFGLDACCGGGLAVRDAAGRHGLDADAVLAALREVVDGP